MVCFSLTQKSHYEGNESSLMIKIRLSLNGKNCQIIISFTMTYTINALDVMIHRQIYKRHINITNFWKILKYHRKYPLPKKYCLHNQFSKSLVKTFPGEQNYVFNDTIRNWGNTALKKLNSPFLLYLSSPTSHQPVFSGNIWKHYTVKLLSYCLYNSINRSW